MPCAAAAVADFCTVPRRLVNMAGIILRGSRQARRFQPLLAGAVAAAGRESSVSYASVTLRMFAAEANGATAGSSGGSVTIFKLNALLLI